ncbi:uncharacterized protein [Chelonus insularis]|uniref:uncharacterized protein isoform X2 n=1 Tax=Chelonus insularis TaxID=460826 RepID=UPI0015895CF2|nr:uncharacterized protein LOC118071667 isoform X2 [Chelonus insularis]
MVPKKAIIFSSYTSLISVYVLLCIIVIIIKNNYFSLILTELKKKNNDAPAGNNHHYNIRDKTDELKTLDLSIDVSEIDSTIERVFNTCDNYNLVTQLKPKHFLHSKKHNVLFCWIRKVASKSFTKFFADLEDYQIMRDSYDRELDSFDVENVEDLVNLIDDRNTFKFFAVRHPFVRLVSSYRDRIEDNSKYSAQAWIYVPKIFHITRPQLFYRNKSTSPLYKIFDRDRRIYNWTTETA